MERESVGAKIKKKKEVSLFMMSAHYKPVAPPMKSMTAYHLWAVKRESLERFSPVTSIDPLSLMFFVAL